MKNLVLVGNAYTLPPFIKTVEEKGQKFQIVGVIDLEDRRLKGLQGYEYYGGLKELKNVLNTEPVDGVVFTVYRQNPKAIEEAMLECYERGVEVWLKPDFMHKALSVVRAEPLVKDTQLLLFSLGPRPGPALFFKRLMDVAISAFLLLMLALPLLVAGMLVSATSPGPVFFLQKRVGRHGRRFTIYKFRTMVSDAEQRRSKYRLKNEMKGPVFKMRKDPRITPFGRFLRKYSIDELPQLWNVFVGDMSLVGPRPPLPAEVSRYKGWQCRRFSMRPGITCLWQVMGRNQISDFEKWVRLDLQYIDEWSLWLDLKILLRTIPIVLKGTGI
jgi:exopolysaccharide biosynthesis polyprenyl glycosylphosphotransferase